MKYTTLKVSVKTKQLLEAMKMFKNESYEDVIIDLLEDHLELNPQFKKELEESFKEIKEGKSIPLSKVLEEVNLGD